MARTNREPPPSRGVVTRPPVNTALRRWNERCDPFSRCSAQTTALRTHVTPVAQGSLYLTGNGMSERTAVLDIAGNPVPEVEIDSNNAKAEMSAPAAIAAADDVLVVEKCFGKHKEQVCVCVCVCVCFLSFGFFLTRC